MDKAEAARRGSLGGKATVNKYGIDHMKRIGAAGFRARAKQLGRGGRRALAAHLDPTSPASAADLRALDRRLGPEQYEGSDE
jgi:hypothetical protein